MFSYVLVGLYLQVCQSNSHVISREKYALYIRTRTTKYKTIYTCMLLFQSPPPLSSSKGIAVSNAANFIMLCCHICAWYLFYFELRPCFTVEALYDLFANWVFSQSSLCRSMLHVLVLPLTKHV